jgi:hypothetical protein
MIFFRLLVKIFRFDEKKDTNKIENETKILDETI